MTTQISNLRALFQKYGIDGYIIPTSDEYQNEYSPDCAKRLQYVTGFTGSNGIAIIMQDNAYFWTDGRYKLQAKKELPDFMICDRDFGMIISAQEIVKIGYNPMLFTSAQIAAFSPKLNLVPIMSDLVDEIWQDKPKAPSSKAYLYPIEYAGLDVLSKLKIARKSLSDKVSYALITQPDSICWLLNIRGADISSVPVILGYLILGNDEVILFTDLSKISDGICDALPYVAFKEQGEIFEQLKLIHGTIMFDPNSCPLGLLNLMSNKIEGVNPCLMPKSCKNDIEIQCAKHGHIKDAVALCEGLAWAQNNRGITEYDIALKLTELSSKQEGYVMNSFPTIAGFRENGAIIHYGPKPNISKIIEGDGMLLIDSGGHYLGATTDVTRVIVFGKPTQEQVRRYTQVLKGHIALAMCKFPEGSFGCNIDICARQFLWEDGVDYIHGTGHGVGNMLSVHEQPSISQAKGNMPLKAGMIVSNEPGFYKEGEFGIRIENLMYVKESKMKGFLEFEMLTLVPYARDLIDVEMLTAKEIEFLRGYYQNIRERVYPLLDGEAKIWCENEMGLVL